MDVGDSVHYISIFSFGAREVRPFPIWSISSYAGPLKGLFYPTSYSCVIDWVRKRQFAPSSPCQQTAQVEFTLFRVLSALSISILRVLRSSSVYFLFNYLLL